MGTWSLRESHGRGASCILRPQGVVGLRLFAGVVSSRTAVFAAVLVARC